MHVSLDALMPSWPTDFYLEGWKFMIVDKMMRERMTKEKLKKKYALITEKYQIP